MTATQLASFFGRLYPHWHGDAVMARIGRLGITADVAFGRLSKGERRQLALALALGSSPELLVLDDPTLGLDVIARRELYEELVGDLADRGTTVFMTSHDLAGIEGIADRVGILHGGRLMVDEELETLKARFRRIRFPAPADGDAEPSGGDELARFGPVSLGPGPWGEEAVVERFEAGTFESVAGSGRFIGAEAAPMNLEEIFSAVALAGERGST
jgi:ABC-2 type transport system ATP-binding protein